MVDFLHKTKECLLIILFVVGILVTNGCNKHKELRGTLNGHEWVDLGLRSGTLWATENIKLYDQSIYFSTYFAWGETSPKEAYQLDNYTYSDKPVILPTNADAATVNWGEGWRMPTKSEFEELLKKCTRTWGPGSGMWFTGPNGNSIFLPAEGYAFGRQSWDLSKIGFYWSSSLYSDDRAYFLGFIPDNVWVQEYARYYGYSIRPVCSRRK